ncbi:unnamed protein product, partial [Clonostachys rosea f. rosea IK726]
MRVPALPNPPPFTNQEDAAIAEGIKERRGALGLLPVDLVLLRSPPVAAGWSGLLKSVRGQTSLPASISETAICRVAALNQAWGEYEPHVPLLKKAKPAGWQDIIEHMRKPAGTVPSSTIDKKHAAVLTYADAVTSIKVDDATFGNLREAGFTDREIVEITAVASAYNCNLNAAQKLALK